MSTEPTEDGIAIQTMSHPRNSILGASLLLEQICPEMDLDDFHLFSELLANEFSREKNLSYEQGKKDMLEEMAHEGKKFIDGFAHPKDCEICKK